MQYPKEKYVLGLLRIGMGWIFLWTFFDKLLGLGFSTTSAQAWVHGISPTLGFLKFGSVGPFASIYQAMAGNAVVDWLYMLGLLCIGVALLLGVGVRIAGYTGSVMMLLIWSVALPPVHNPFMDEHIVYILVLLGLAFARAGNYLGLGQWWANTKLVQRYTILQ